MSSAPTASTSPTFPPSARTLPAAAEGISTVALSVIVGQRLVLCHGVADLHIPFSGQFNFGDAFADVRHFDDVDAACVTPPAVLHPSPPAPGTGK